MTEEQTKMTNIQRILEKVYNEPLREIIRRMYIDECIPMYKIAENLGVANSTVQRWIKQYELHYKRPSWNKGLSKSEMEQIVELNKR